MLQSNYRSILRYILFILLLLFSIISMTSVSVQGATNQINIDDFIYASFLGGSNKDIIRDGVIDSQGNIIVTGQTLSEDFPVLNAIQDTFAGGDDDYHTIGGDTIVSKFDPNGQLVWSTYFGGSNRDSGQKIMVDETGTIFIVGLTNSEDYPVTEDALESSYNGGQYDLFLLKIASNGSLLYSSYFGTEGDEYTEDAEMSSLGNIIIVGGTNSANLPVTDNATQPNITGTQGGFIVSWNNDFKAIAYCSYFSGSGGDIIGSIALDPEDNIFVTGVTTSSSFPITDNAYQSEYDSITRDFYLAKFNSTYSLEYSTFFGGSAPDDCFGVALDSNGNMYFSGRTWSSDFPVVNAFQENLTEDTVDGYIASLNANGENLQFSSYIGGSGWDTILQVAVDEFSNVFGVGFGGPNGFPIKRAFQEANNGVTDLVFLLLSPLGEPAFCSYYGGSDIDLSRNIFLTSNFSLVVGETHSSDFPISYDAFQPNFHGSSEQEGFFLRFDYVNYLESVNEETNTTQSTSTSESTNGFDLIILLISTTTILLKKRKLTK